jgi:hypothetical protein
MHDWNVTMELDARSLIVRVGETLPVAFDFRSDLADGEVLDGHAAPTATLIALADDGPTDGLLLGPQTIHGTRVQQLVTGLRAGHRSRLELRIQPAPGRTCAAELELEVREPDSSPAA